MAILQTSPILHAACLALLRVTGARGVVLLMVPAEGEEGEPLILREGDPQALEMAVPLSRAKEFLRGPTAKRLKDDLSPLRVLPGNGGLHLVRVLPDRFLQLLEQQPGDDSHERRTLPVRRAMPETVWIGLCFAEGESPPLLGRLPKSEGWLGGEGVGSDAEWFAWLANLVTLLVWQGDQISRLMRDPISRLPGRSEFQAVLAALDRRFRQTGDAFTLLLINPDDYASLNQRFGREAGDQGLREIAAEIQRRLRRTDRVFRYGGAMFAALLPGTGRQQAETVARKVRAALVEHPFLDGSVRLGFSIGLSSCERAMETPPQDPPEVVRRADQALGLARVRGGAVLCWKPDLASSDDVGRDRLQGIFNADVVKDYRNMQLLWDLVALVSTHTDTDRILRHFLDRIQQTFGPARLAVCRLEERRIEVVAGCRQGGGEGSLSELTAEESMLVGRAMEEGRTLRRSWKGGDDPSLAGERIGYALPIVARERVLGCLYLAEEGEPTGLDSSDLVFLRALTDQVALALDRADLVQRAQQRQEQEKRKLRAELRGLREVVQESRLIYRSAAMEALLATLRQIAPTDATVLINGESGTGKEMLARTLHELSDRRDRPMVVVDCGAIAHSLMERELFGHERGAYTGADRRVAGRLEEARGGTLLLDEIGEVPLELQPKLLRFVQEKEIVPVGSSRPIRVDVRILAATNRDLWEEVKAGRFREDLFYRLNVISVVSPPLRERPDDILPLARHFLERYSLQYHKPVRRFTPGAERRMRAYEWPGNVRELQNRILSAVVICSGEEIGEAELRLGISRPESVCSPRGSAPAEIAPPAVEEIRGGDQASPPLEEVARHLLERMLQLPPAVRPPLERRVTDLLFRLALKRSGGVLRRAAASLGVPETTFRRRMRGGEQGDSAEDARLEEILEEFLGTAPSPIDSSMSLPLRLRYALLRAVDARYGGRVADGAALLGVSLATYRKWRAEADSAR